MWYFTWILGVLLACSFGIINAMWLESTEDMDRAVESDHLSASENLLNTKDDANTFDGSHS